MINPFTTKFEEVMLQFLAMQGKKQGNKLLEHRIVLMHEEMAELSQVLCKFARGKANLDNHTDIYNLMQEIADVFVVIYPIIKLFGINDEDIATTMVDKVNRAIVRMEGM